MAVFKKEKKEIACVLASLIFLVWTVVTDYEPSKSFQIPLMLIAVVAIGVVIFVGGPMVFNRNK